ncbi:MAG TPA: terminase family protein [Sphingomicrobium sp.]|nr:terminase family protein [Sphingomicrobium sp.]
MRFKSVSGFIRLLLSASREEQRRLIWSMTAADLLALDADFETWAHDSQLPPRLEGWRTWLMMAGRGFGKTRAGSEWIEKIARSRPGVRIALVGATIDEARRVMVEGVSGILNVAKTNRSRVKWEPSLGRLRWPNGSEAQLFSGDNPDGLRGPEHDFAWCDELAKWRCAEASWDNLQFGLRRGRRPRALVTTTPRTIDLLKRIRGDERTITTTGRTDENINLDEHFVEMMVATYGGTRVGRQELDGELIEEIEGALWTRELIERVRLPHPQTPSPEGEGAYERIVVGVDPPAGVGEGCDACGIVVCGRSGDALYVIADETVQGLSPEGWANRVAAAAARWGASIVVAEANNGGAMVASVLKAAVCPVKVKLVHASKGKVARAEPVALRFEAGRAFLCGSFPGLEDQMAGMVAGGEYEGPGRSPDRADAMVWAMTELGETRSGLPRVRRL